MGTNILKQFLVLGEKPVLMHSLIKFYEFDKNFHVMSKNYLINKKELKMKQNLIVNQGKAK